MYVIGTAESNCDWGACNYVDAITVGMMQWYGTRARNLLERGRTADPDGWNTFASAAPTLAQQVQANDINWSAPRTCGDDPGETKNIAVIAVCSPHMRG